LPVLVGDDTRLYDIKKLDSKLQVVESKEKQFQTVQELPNLSDAPVSLTTKNLYVYNRDDLKYLEYFDAAGKLIAAVPSSKTETNQWKLETLSQSVDPYDLFKEYSSQFPAESLKTMNLFENDLYAIFAASPELTSFIATPRSVIKVLE